MTDLPIEAVLPELEAALADHSAAVLEAPPGAGKTTRVPLALLEAPWLAGRRIVMLEPRRLAARAAAQRMADMLGEAVGETVGYRTRLDSVVGRTTRIEVVTEGILTRRLQSDPGLEGVGLVIFDEFHERSLQADLGLALTLEVTSLRDDLKLLVMSATLDGSAVAALLGGAPVIRTQGRSFPVETRHLRRPPRDRFVPAMAEAVRRALADTDGDMLVFLPGEGEIRRLAALIAEAGLPESADVMPLYGALDRAAQDAAIRPSAGGRRKVVLATSIAETSLTIDGVRVVIDGGLSRRARFDPVSAMSRLETVPVSRAAAEQRRGRAGRTAPGVCYRLWSLAEERGLVAYDRPEILDADLAPLALELAQWGVRDASTLAWLDPPPEAALAQARDLLRLLGAVDSDGGITAHGRAMARLGAHPRLAHMLLAAQEHGEAAIACEIAALIEERDILVGSGCACDADLRTRIEILRHGARGGLPAGARLDEGARRRALLAARAWRRRLGVEASADPAGAAGRISMLAYPDRIAQQRGGIGRFRLAGGRGASLPPEDPLAGEALLAVATVGGGEADARIRLAVPIVRQEIESAFADRIIEADEIAYDARADRVTAHRLRRFMAIVLDERPIERPDQDAVARALSAAVAARGIGRLPWSEEARQLRARVALLRRISDGMDWPDLSDEALAATIGDWLAPHLVGVTRLADLSRLDLATILASGLDWEARRRLDDLAPTHLEVPSGSRLRLDYCAGEIPVLAVKLQEMFGATETPRIAGGRVPVLVHLLSPAGRPVQITSDLATFWRDGYRQVKAEMKGRYPKHPWPDDPLTAAPTARTKRVLASRGG
ncbi:ATP-dependent helicase HrpB [Tepidamorphus gemmatus]|uniref:ATP-dependent helicase HrpB n=1 Tax=Tepidamorphus gemmatus TaxID=747076 RepID=A0A4R3M7Z0_9HYPH|nr:ATP-dependent helicase HrpB [Tepidamorphus gemmatus]TCT08409.1 ATP-dependent helicase HrpB [Tepidamorphus gemmatus]